MAQFVLSRNIAEILQWIGNTIDVEKLIKLHNSEFVEKTIKEIANISNWC